MTDWASDAMSVYRDFKADGFPVTVRIAGSDGTWDPEAMAYTGGESDTDYIAYAIKSDYAIRDINGTTIQQNDTRLLLSAYGLNDSEECVPLPDLTTANKILIDGKEQNVISISATAPGNVALFYTVQVRS